MIPYVELEQAINRWKSRKAAEAAGEAPVPELMAGPAPEERPDEAAPLPSESKVSESGEISLGDDMLMEEDQ